MNQVFADQLRGAFGIAFYPLDGEPQWLYVANLNSVVRIPYREGACCFGAAELDRKEPKLEDPALREYSGKPDFETWLGDEYRRHADAHRHEENCKNARTHWTPGTTVK